MSQPAQRGLQESQQLFWRLITAPAGVARGARDLAAEGAIDSDDLSFLVEPLRRLSSTRRLDIYADMYFYRLRDCLADDFSKVAAVVGGARFHNFVTDFLLVHPSSHPSLRSLGVPLPEFLATHPLSDDFPYLADLARLEWGRIDVFDEADAEPLTRDILASLTPERAQTLPLQVVPACRLLELEWSVAPLWRQIEKDLGTSSPSGTHSAAVESEDGFAEPFTAVKPPEKRPAFIRTWRQGFRVYHRSMAMEEAICLRRLRDGGASVVELAGVLLEVEGAGGGETAPAGEPSGEQAALQRATRRLAELMGLWMEDGLICSPGEEPHGEA